MMFKIDLQIQQSDFLTGLEALNERRRLGLNDDSLLAIASGRTRWVEVSEEFARQHFGPSDREITREIPVSLCQRGDCAMNHYGALVIADDTTDERIQQLWLMGSTVE